MKKKFSISIGLICLALSSTSQAEQGQSPPNHEHREYLGNLRNSDEHKEHQTYVKDFKNTDEYREANWYLTDLKGSESGQDAQRYIGSMKENIKPADKNEEESDFSVADVASGTPPDACKVAMCMMGEVTGNSGGSECRNPIKKFFSINAFKKKGHFDASKTSDWRKSFLGECPDLTKEFQDKIISKFGRVRG